MSEALPPRPRPAPFEVVRGVRTTLAAMLVIAGLLLSATTAGAAVPSGNIPDFGPNVTIFDPSVPTDEINTTLESLAQEETASLNRHQVYFMPGTYGSAAGQDNPGTATGIIDSPVGFYETIAGLGASPDDVTINGNLRAGAETGWQLGVFWRSLSNLKINPIQSDEPAHTMRWNTSQASPLRRVDIAGDLDLGNGIGFGNAIINSKISGTVDSGNRWKFDPEPTGGQTQYFVRDSQIGGWLGHGANLVFSGVDGAPPAFFDPGGNTVLPETPISRDAPFLYVRGDRFQVFVPKARTKASGPNWGVSPADGTSLPIEQFFIAKPSDSAEKINRALRDGKHLILTPGIYSLDEAIRITRPNTVVMGMGLATLTPTNGNAVIDVADVGGVTISSLTVDNGTQTSDVLVRIGSQHGRGREVSYPGKSPYRKPVSRRGIHPHRGWGDHGGPAAQPTTLNDIFLRIGGTNAGSATTSLVINQDDVLIDNAWLWRADHGAAGTTGWDVNPASHGLVVNGNRVHALSLYVEHYQETQVVWNGNDGSTIGFVCEPPYDPPSQAEWMNGSEDGFPCYEVARGVRSHDATALSNWVLFNADTDPPIHQHTAFKTPVRRDVRFHNTTIGILLGDGIIDNMFNESGGGANGVVGPPSIVTILQSMSQLHEFPGESPSW